MFVHWTHLGKQRRLTIPSACQTKPTTEAPKCWQHPCQRMLWSCPSKDHVLDWLRTSLTFLHCVLFLVAGKSKGELHCLFPQVPFFLVFNIKLLFNPKTKLCPTHLVAFMKTLGGDVWSMLGLTKKKASQFWMHLPDILFSQCLSLWHVTCPQSHKKKPKNAEVDEDTKLTLC